MFSNRVNRNRWFSDPVNLVEAAVVLVAAAALWSLASGQSPPGQWLDFGLGMGGWVAYAVLRRWRPAVPRSPQEPVPAPPPWLGRVTTVVLVLALIPALTATGVAAGVYGNLPAEAVPGPRPIPPGLGPSGLAASGLRWATAWPVTLAAVLALWQMARRDGRLRFPARRLLAAALVLFLAGGLVEELPGAGGSPIVALPHPALRWAGWLSLVAVWGYQLTLARLSAYASARWRLEAEAVHPRGDQAPSPPKARPPVVLSGFFGAGNAGDEAILAAVLNQLRQRGYHDITVFSTRPAETARTHGVRAVYRGWRRDLWAKARALGRAGVFISGGGGLLQDTSRTFLLRGPVPYYLLIATWARLAGCWVLFLGHGVGPLRGRWARFLTRWLASQADVITTRDEGSLQVLEQVGVRRPVRETLADFVFSLPRAPASATEKTERDGRLIAVSVRSWPGQDRFFPELAAFLGHVLATRPDAEVVLVPMEGEPDRRASEELAALIAGADSGRLQILPPHLSPAELEAAVARSWLAVGMRLHFLIFAVRAGVPVLALNYDPKVAGVLGRLGLDRYVYDLETVTAKDLEAGLEAVEAGYDDLRRQITEATRPMAALASAHLDYADAASRRWSGEL